MSFLVSIQGFGVYSFNRVVLAPNQSIVLDANQDEQSDSEEQDESDSDSIPIPLTLPDEETKEDCVDIDDLVLNQSLIYRNSLRLDFIKRDFYFFILDGDFIKEKIPTPPPDLLTAT
ncbi:hypothetical protein [Roseivirga echinicomitans]|uniref:Uncharacterized protein n=1 Tax=Roseivirga echinicomitans TaxID=296218 RepID=A0A150XVS7_9BACT|nr:hypothetical protein [Roseivirga echinicomitans]KYG82742.1 hypothetical protein AWN68_13200 [Roseivirga echinicomitans]